MVRTALGIAVLLLSACAGFNPEIVQIDDYLTPPGAETDTGVYAIEGQLPEGTLS